MKRILFSIALFLLALSRTAAASTAPEERSTLWKGHGWEGRISRDGCLEQIVFFHDRGRDNDTVPFFKAAEQFRGPSFYAVLGSGETVDAVWIPDGHLSYRTGIDGVECSLTYTSWKGEPALRITLTNRGHVPFQPVKAGLRMGIDTYMDTYPEWFGKYFPTLMRNEKTHFTGYLQTPSGHTLGLVCPQPVASWSVEYNLGYQDPAPHWFMGHRIESLNIDLLNALPLPSRNPQDLWCLRQGESRSWTLVLIDIEDPGQFEAELSSIADIPMIRMERTGYGAGETAVFDVLGDSPQVIVTDDSGRQMDLAVGKIPGTEGAVRISCPLTETGLYTVKVTDGDRQAEGILTVMDTGEGPGRCLEILPESHLAHRKLVRLPLGIHSRPVFPRQGAGHQAHRPVRIPFQPAARHRKHAAAVLLLPHTEHLRHHRHVSGPLSGPRRHTGPAAGLASGRLAHL